MEDGMIKTEKISEYTLKPEAGTSRCCLDHHAFLFRCVHPIDVKNCPEFTGQF